MGDVIDLDAARERNRSETKPHLIVEALDALALALAEHGHTWTDREHHLYQTAVAYVGAPA